MKIYLVRHGETDANHQKLIQGRTDNPLNQNGILQAQNLGNYFKQNEITFDAIYSSPLKRAYQTAVEISAVLQLHIPISKNDHFTERDFGDFEMKPITDERVSMYKNNIIPNGESNQALQSRVLRGLQEIAPNHSQDIVLITAHSHTIKGLLVELSNGAIPYDLNLVNTAITILEYSNNAFTILDYNIKDHL